MACAVSRRPARVKRRSSVLRQNYVDGSRCCHHLRCDAVKFVVNLPFGATQPREVLGQRLDRLLVPIPVAIRFGGTAPGVNRPSFSIATNRLLKIA